MNTKSFFSACFAVSAIALTATSAQAHYFDYPLEPEIRSTLTRAEVQAEVLKSANRFDGMLNEWVRTGPVTTAQAMPLQRKQVLAETLEAIRVGALDRHEQTAFATAEQLESIRQAGLRAIQMQVAAR